MATRGEQTLFGTRWQHASVENKKGQAQAKGVVRNPMGVPVGGYQERRQRNLPPVEESSRMGKDSSEGRPPAPDGGRLEAGAPFRGREGRGTTVSTPIANRGGERALSGKREAASLPRAVHRPSHGLMWLWILLFFLALLTVIDFPYVSRVKGLWEREKLIREYESLRGEMEQRKLRERLMDARGYNERLFSLSEEGEINPFSREWGKSYSGGDKSEMAVLYRSYRSFPYLAPSQLMGYVVIPSLGLRLPIYPEGKSALEAFHLEGTSLPVGGSSTHAWIMNGEGEESKRIFASLERLNKGDTFFVHLLGYSFAYRVLRQKEGKMEDVSSLQLHKNQDLVSLIYRDGEKMTCYTGSRIKYNEKEERALPGWRVILEDWWWAMLSVFLLIFMILVLQWLYSPSPSHVEGQGNRGTRERLRRF